MPRNSIKILGVGIHQKFSQCIKYLEILHDERPLDDHNRIVSTAKEIFEQAGYDIVGQFGVHFDIRRGDDHKFFIIPINATDEYFAVLKEQVK